MIRKIILLLVFPALLSYGQNLPEMEMKAASKLIAASSSEAYKSDTTIDAGYYKIDLKIEMGTGSLSGSAALKFTSLYADRDSFFMDLTGSLTVDSVWGNGAKLEYAHIDNKVTFTTGAKLNAGQEYTAVVYYHGTPPSTGIYGSYVLTEKDGYPTLWTITEPFGASDWFPCKNTPSDKADSSEVWITCRNDLAGISNGVLISEEDNGDGTKTYKWKESYPIAHYLICLNIGRYDKYETEYEYAEGKTMPLVNYYYQSAEQAANMPRAADIAKGTLDIYTDLFGEYPFGKEKCGFVELYADWAGMENQTITCLCRFDEYLIIHETAHQWFGNKITCADWHNVWLNEGFATYAECLYYERLYGAYFYHLYVEDYITYGRYAKGPIYVQDLSDAEEIFDPSRTYYKGAVVLHMLRKVVGDETFFKILKNYMSNPALSYSTATIDDFQNAAEAEYGQPLDYFFNEWIYGENYPKYSMDWGATINGAETTVQINLKQKVNTNPAYFTMPVDLLIHLNDMDTTITVFNNAQEQSFTFQLPGSPVSIEIDPDNWILKDVENIGVEDEPNILKTFSLGQNYPNPFNPSTKITFSIPETGRVKLTVYDALGKQITIAADEIYTAGEHSVTFNANGLASGVYFYKLEWKDKVDTRKMIVVK